MVKLLELKTAVFVLLVLTSARGQQYTGVKLVSPLDTTLGGVSSPEADHGGGTGASSGISARSIDRLANEYTAPDSKIIKLSIKPIEPQVRSGLRGTRNLGFSADASLNTIPGGLNNELSNVDLKHSISATSAPTKDSYGNPVTPYSDVGTTGLDSVGFLTDVNKDALQSPIYNFKVPSYASGILEPVLFPPNPPANFINQQPTYNRYTTTTAAPTTAFQFVPNAKIPTVEEGNIFFAQQPLNGLVPPLYPGEEGATYNIEVKTERSPIFSKDPFGETTVNKELTPPHNSPPVNFNQGAPQPHAPAQTPLQIPIPTPPLVQAAPQTPQQHLPRPTQAPAQMYTGSFGGAPGFLGNQQNIGTAYTSTPKPNKPVPPPTAPTPPPTQFQPASRPAVPTQAPNKFTGSFGGAPGFLGSQQNYGTAFKPTTASPPVHQQPAFFQPPPPPPQTQAPSIVKPPSPFQPLPPPQPTRAPGGTYTGGFGFGNNTPQQQQPRPTQSPGQYVGNRFNGSFGGAPGLLGNQKKPGTHVKPDGTILPPSSPGFGFTSPAGLTSTGTSRPTQSNGGNTFTGSFGGPPGILRPFDNTKG